MSLLEWIKGGVQKRREKVSLALSMVALAIGISGLVGAGPQESIEEVRNNKIESKEE